MPGKHDEDFNKQQTSIRLQKALQGAFSGPPTPLKEIPTRYGESRKLKPASGASSANAKTASPQKKDRA